MIHKETRINEMLINLILLVSVIAAATFIIAVFKLKGGLVGLVLGAIVVIALIYWIMEIKRSLYERRENIVKERDWFFDLIEKGEDIIFVARVPGPPKDIKVKIIDDILEIRGGGSFLKKVQVPRGARLLEKSYKNGVLWLRLQRPKIEQKRLQ
ncbi:MAG: Hsp20/alpha crystallin family protein [Candidatus Bathyarchaeia archaeon]